ncbi:MAG: alkaline phosphatase family protein [Chitinophagales bacterium]|nr:alkaline phosphatase family protein [Chitinophagales bacterium]
MRKCFSLLSAILFYYILFAQTATPPLPSKPKLIVGVIVDQMRWDFLYRYSEKYTTGGFKRLLNEGYNCHNAYINYYPSYTACGHSCVYTGSVPAIHGIAGNAWFNRGLGREMTSVEDTTVMRTGNGKLSGKVSPRNILTTTIGDEIHIANNFQSKVIGIALKDRSSVLPAGHTGNAAYFLDGATGNFISSTYYMNELPAWATAFNEQKKAAKYLADNWSTILPIAEYWESTADDEHFERPFKGEEKPVFTHEVSKLANSSLDIIAATPFGNSLSFDFAKAAIENEKLGKGKFTDLLALSLSSPDLIGHQFGPNSVEVEDCYIRLDKEFADFLTYLDRQVGKGNYLLFLTADHGAAHAAGYSQRSNIPAGSFDIDTVTKQLNTHLAAKFGEGKWILSNENMQLYVNYDLLQQRKLSREEIFEPCKQFMMQYESVTNVIDLEKISAAPLEANLKMRYTNGYHPKRSGDFQIVYNPAWLEGFTKGTTHGSPYPYDTHIPLTWFGWKVKAGQTTNEVYMTDIAPTIAALLQIQEPNGNIGKVIQGIFGK